MASFSSDQIKSLQFTSWWVENGEKNLIVIVFRLDGQPHEIIIKDTKYYVKELYSADKRNTTQLACWDLFVGASVDIFGKATVLKQADLKTAEWNKFYASFLTEMKNTFIEELKKYERRALDPWMTKTHQGTHQSSAHLRKLILQVTSLKQRMSGYRPLLSDDIVVAFESLL